MARGAVVVLAVSFALWGCSDPADQVTWTGSVEAEVDNLTGQRTGLFRTYGPSENLVAGPDTIPISVGYWCRVDQVSEPPGHRDGLFFRVSMPDTSLLVDDEEVFEELSGQLGLLDVARMAVDGRVYAWEYQPRATHGGWFLEGEMGFRPDMAFDTQEKRDYAMEQVVMGYDLYLNTRGGQSGRMRTLGEEALEAVRDLETVLREGWVSAHDYAASHYFGRDSVGIELKGVLKFPLDGLAAAADSVRFWCPVVEAQLEWNRLRSDFVARMDSLRLLFENQLQTRRRAIFEEIERELLQRIAEAEAENRRRETAQRAAAQPRRDPRGTGTPRSARRRPSRSSAEAERVESESERVARELLESRMSRVEAQGGVRLEMPLRGRIATYFLQAARELGVTRIRSEEDIEQVCRTWRAEGGASLSGRVTVPFGRVTIQQVCGPPEPDR